jgi:hypothetical protein
VASTVPATPAARAAVDASASPAALLDTEPMAGSTCHRPKTSELMSAARQNEWRRW